MEPVMTYIKNMDALTAGKQEEKLRRMALDIADKTIHHCNPGVVTKSLVFLAGNTLTVEGTQYDLSQGARIFVIGAGKATFPIAKALEDVLGDRIHAGLVICKQGEEGRLSRIEMIQGSHPIPDEHSYLGAKKTVELLSQVQAGDIVIACFTGGSSSLFVSPAAGISLEDKAATGKILLTCGANIIEINNVRKHISKVKGGRLIAGLPAGTNLINLTVSDVIGDALDYITDPSVPDTSDFVDAQATLNKYHLWDKLPASVTEYIKKAPKEDETQKASDLTHLNMQHIILLPADAACSAAVSEAQKLGLNTLLLSSFFEGESSVLGRNFAAIAKQIKLNGNPIKTPCCIIAGGETTVLIAKGFNGQGGPNQEFSLSAARELEGETGIVVLGLDTDGTDGPTPYAGGLVDGGTALTAREKGVDLAEAVASHNTSPALNTLGDIVVSGNTGTNVNDLKIMIVV
jgi:hydroxypyruvate reductase/glycerate 2-kinase